MSAKAKVIQIARDKYHEYMYVMGNKKTFEQWFQSYKQRYSVERFGTSVNREWLTGISKDFIYIFEVSRFISCD